MMPFIEVSTEKIPLFSNEIAALAVS